MISCLKCVLHSVPERGAFLIVFGRQGFAELLHQFLLSARQLLRRFDADRHVLVALAVAVDVFDALAAHSEFLACLGAFRNLHLDLAVDRRHFDAVAQSRLHKGNRQFDVNIVASALEDRVFLHVDVNQNVAAGTTVGTGITLTSQRQDGVVVDPGRNRDLDRAFLFFESSSMAVWTRIVDDLPFAVAFVADHRLSHHAKGRLTAHRDLAAAAALVTGSRVRAFLRARAAAGRAGFPALDLDLLFRAENGVLKGQPQVDAHVGASGRAASAGGGSATAAEAAKAAAKQI